MSETSRSYTVGQLLSVRDALLSIERRAQQHPERLPFKTAYRLSRLSDRVASELRAYDKARKAAIDELGVERAARPQDAFVGTVKDIALAPVEQQQEFRRRLDELEAEPASLGGLPLPIDLTDVKDGAISPAELRMLGDIVTVSLG